MGQVETGVVVPLIGAPEASFFGGLLVGLMSVLTIWRVPRIRKFKLGECSE
jgi:hypothetical protein